MIDRKKKSKLLKARTAMFIKKKVISVYLNILKKHVTQVKILSKEIRRISILLLQSPLLAQGSYKSRLDGRRPIFPFKFEWPRAFRL